MFVCSSHWEIRKSTIAPTPASHVWRAVKNDWLEFRASPTIYQNESLCTFVHVCAFSCLCARLCTFVLFVLFVLVCTFFEVLERPLQPGELSRSWRRFIASRRPVNFKRRRYK
jgi:hypothetical protein